MLSKISKRSKFFAYISLTKPRIILLVTFTSICGISFASIDITIKSLMSLCAIALGAGGSAAINMWYDKDIDSKMLRTRNRALVLGIINHSHGLILGGFLSIISLTILWYFTNLLSTSLMFIAIMYYSVIYTMILKRNCVYNVVIGGVPGAMPPLIGYSAINEQITIEVILLALVIFFWSPVHSWALAIFRLKDFAKSNLPMLPLVKGIKQTIFQMYCYSILTIVSSYTIYFIHLKNIIDLILITILNFFLIYFIYKLDKKNHLKYARALFMFSTIYLFFLFLIILIWNMVKNYK